MIEEGMILINTDKKVVGQINGLAVYSLGHASFGKPSRLHRKHWCWKSWPCQH